MESLFCKLAGNLIANSYDPQLTANFKLEVKEKEEKVVNFPMIYLNGTSITGLEKSE